ncbi:MAG: electron transport complex subunit E [Nitrospirota bacterium]|nr:electron transport complex subunit E [Nitrospirota bacterium]
MSRLIGEFSKGLWKENPLLVFVLGLCPALAVSSTAANGLGMGLASTFVLTSSNLVVSACRKVIPANVRIPAFIVIVATFVTVTDLVVQAFFPALSKSLGIFIPLIVANCIILGRAESFASKNSVVMAGMDGLGMGFGFTVALTVLAAIREILGSGTLFGSVLFGENYQPMLTMVLAPGAFIALGILLAIMNKINAMKKAK